MDQHAQPDVPCRNCGELHALATDHYRRSLTGVVDRVYVCTACGWGMLVRYVTGKPGKWILCQLASPQQKLLGKRVDSLIKVTDKR